MTLGYDVGMRAMKTVLGETVLRDTHNVVGTFGASAAAGCVANLNAQQMRWLLDYASQQAGAGGIAPRSVELYEASAAVNDVRRPSRFGQQSGCLFPFRSEQQARPVRLEVA